MIDRLKTMVTGHAAPVKSQRSEPSQIKIIPNGGEDSPSGGPALLILDSDPSGATVYLGGRKAGTTPYQNLELAAGQTLQITLSKPDYHDQQRQLTLHSGINEPDILVLPPAFGQLSIDSDPSGADVYLAGTKVGTTPYHNAQLSAGDYLLSLKRPLHQTLSHQEITINDGQHQKKHYRLPANYGELHVTSTPVGAAIQINNNSQGQNIKQTQSPAHIKLNAGHYQLTLSAVGYASQHYELDIARGKTLRIDQAQSHLRRLEGHVLITTEPYEKGANIYVDKQTQASGQIPTQLTLSAGSHLIRIEGKTHSGERRIDVADRKIQALMVTLINKPHPPGKSYRNRLKGGGQGPEMVVIPAGTFRMGDLQDTGDNDENPVHQVTISTFSLGKTEVSFADYDRYAQATGKNKPDDEGWGRGDRPVINVNWHEATAYAAWLTQQTGQHYRLPSEAEWEYAARAGGDTQYSWGNAIGRNQANCDGCGSRWDKKKTAPVKSFKANAFGLYDMHGNVWEWVQDCWNSGYQGAPDDGKVWLKGMCSRRVLRGGSWNLTPYMLRSAFRFWNYTDFRDATIGFRLVQD